MWGGFDQPDLAAFETWVRHHFDIRYSFLVPVKAISKRVSLLQQFAESNVMLVPALMGGRVGDVIERCRNVKQASKEIQQEISRVQSEIKNHLNPLRDQDSGLFQPLDVHQVACFTAMSIRLAQLREQTSASATRAQTNEDSIGNRMTTAKKEKVLRQSSARKIKEAARKKKKRTAVREKGQG